MAVAGPVGVAGPEGSGSLGPQPPCTQDLAASFRIVHLRPYEPMGAVGAQAPDFPGASSRATCLKGLGSLPWGSAKAWDRRGPR